MAESKLHENLRYLGYTIGIIGGMVLIGMAWLFIAPILEFIWSMIFIFVIICFIIALAIAIIYLAFFRNRE